MKTLRAALTLALPCLLIAGCASGPESGPAVTQSHPIPPSTRLGSGDAVGKHLFKSDKAIAGAESRDRALASHPEDEPNQAPR